MIVSETFLSKARSAFDLNEYEIKTWTALLSLNESTAGELAEISTVPRSRVYDILESLTAKGFVVKKKGTPIRYRTVQPKEALTAAKKNALKKANEEAESFEKVKATSQYKELDKLYKTGSVSLKADVSGVIKGRDNINSQLISLVSGAKKSIFIATTRQGLLRKAEKLGKELKEAKKRGVSVKLAAPLNSLADLPKELSLAEARKTNCNDARFVIADGKNVLLMLNSDEEVHRAYDVGIWLNSQFAAKGFEHFFENSWKGMEKL